MKKLIFTLFFLPCLLITHAQLFYGVAESGGTNEKGTLFSFSPVGNKYTNYKNFNGPDGAYPVGGLVLATDGKFYGMTLSGGNHEVGVIFSFDPATKVFNKRKDFDLKDGGDVQGNSLTQAKDGKLYGMTWGGGSNRAGVIFSFDPATDTYTKLKDFGGKDGENPLAGKLLQATNGKLYGMASRGGSQGAGVIFSFDPATKIYTKLKDFGGNDGSYATGGLMQAEDGNLYGMTAEGGSNRAGVIFSFDPATDTYAKIRDFTFGSGDGRMPFGSLVQATDGKLYGMTSYSGSESRGTIFSFDPSTKAFAKLKTFSLEGYEEGADPNGSLVQATDGKLYGVTDGGGIDLFNPGGVIFSFDPATKAFAKLDDFSLEGSRNPHFGFLSELLCKGTTYYRDADGDGYGDPAYPECFSAPTAGYVTNNTDCNDSNAAAHPGAVEVCNGIDDNCDGVVDEGCTVLIDSFTLVNAVTNGDVRTIHDNEVLNMTTLPRVQFNIRANAKPANIGSIVFELSGAKKYRHVENGAPYALFKNSNGNYFGGQLDQGDYTLTATPYSKPAGEGVKGTPRTIHFKVVYFASIVNVILVRAPDGKLISSDPLGEDEPWMREGQVINLATLPTTQISIETYEYNSLLRSVVFDLSGTQSHHQVENISPYALFGGGKNSYHAWTPAPGTYTLTITPYSAANGKGTKGMPYTLHFTVVNTPLSVTRANSSQSESNLENKGQNPKTLTASPNPFSSQSTVRFSVPKTGQTVLGVYNTAGVEVARLFQGKAEAGREYRAMLNGQQLPTGIYLLRMISGNQTSSLKTVLIR